MDPNQPPMGEYGDVPPEGSYPTQEPTRTLSGVQASFDETRAELDAEAEAAAQAQAFLDQLKMEINEIKDTISSNPLPEMTMPSPEPVSMEPEVAVIEPEEGDAAMMVVDGPMVEEAPVAMEEYSEPVVTEQPPEPMMEVAPAVIPQAAEDMMMEDPVLAPPVQIPSTSDTSLEPEAMPEPIGAMDDATPEVVAPAPQMVAPAAAPVVIPQPVQTTAAPVRAAESRSERSRARRAARTPSAVPHAQPAAAPIPPPPAKMENAEQEALAKARGRRPVVVSTANHSNMAPAVNQSAPRTTTTAAVADQMRVVEQDAQTKSRNSRPVVVTSATQAGQVMAGPPLQMGSVSAPIAGGGQVPPAARSAPMSQSERDAEAKNRARRGYTPHGPPVVQGAAQVGPPVTESVADLQSTGPGGLSELARRREQRAAARANRRGGSSAVAPPAATGPPQPKLSDAERQQRYEQKMSQMDQANADGREKRAASNGPAPVPNQRATTMRGNNVQQISQSERQRRYDAKMAQMDQNHSDSREKRGGGRDGEEPVPTRQPRPADSKLGMMNDTSSSYPAPTSTNTYSHLAPTPSPAVTTTADHGVAVAPDVEYGEYESPQVPDGELAVAVAIDEEEEEDKDIVYAVEYDPDSKPPIYQNRRFRYYGIGGACVFVILAAILVAGIVAGSKTKEIVYTPAPTGAPTAPPTSTREGMYYQRFAQEFAGKAVKMAPPSDLPADEPIVSPLQEFLANLQDQETAHYKAAQWIINEDPVGMDVQDPLLIQRYMMAFLWFSTTESGTKPWRSCNPPNTTAGEDDTCTFLEFTRLPDDSIGYTPKEGKVRWLSGQGVCKWEGVLCGGGAEVLGVDIFGQGLTGTLPKELIAMDFIQQISLAYNELTGTIPREWAEMKHLINLELHGNLLDGSIPEEFFEEDKLSLVNLNVGDNLFEGQLDTRIGQMTDLKGLHLFQNNFDGPFPAEVGNLDYLSFSRINGNSFEGPLPKELGSLRQLTELWYHENLFTGTIPSELGRLGRLQDLRLWGNQFTGSIPSHLFNMKKLIRFSVRDNKLTGTLPTEVGQLKVVQQLKVSNNMLTGPIPSEIKDLPKLRLAWLHLNLFEGAVPTSICNLVGPGGLEFFQADCHPIDNPPNECICCSACCDREATTDSGEAVCLATNI